MGSVPVNRSQHVVEIAADHPVGQRGNRDEGYRPDQIHRSSSAHDILQTESAAARREAVHARATTAFRRAAAYGVRAEWRLNAPFRLRSGWAAL